MTGQFVVERPCPQHPNLSYSPEVKRLLPYCLWVELEKNRTPFCNGIAYRLAYGEIERVSKDLGIEAGNFVCEHMGGLIE